MRRPGVATSRSTPLVHSATEDSIAMPPNARAHRTSVRSDSALARPAAYVARLRVGTSTIARGLHVGAVFEAAFAGRLAPARRPTRGNNSGATCSAPRGVAPITATSRPAMTIGPAYDSKSVGWREPQLSSTDAGSSISESEATGIFSGRSLPSTRG